MQRATWTDERLDEFSQHVGRRFDHVDECLKGDNSFVKTDIAEIRASIDRLNLTLTRGLIGVIVCLIGVLAATALS